ncbi:MAG: DUF4352 domain-containing protein [Candidatus Weimeria sp.]
MRKSIILTTTILGISVMLSGCAFQVTELKEEDQDKVAAYCAQIVSKYNESPDKGLAVLPDEKQQQTDSSAEVTSSDGSTDQAADTQSAETTSDAGTVETKTFTEAIGIKGVSVLFRDARTAGGYSSSDVYDLSPDKGNELLVVRLKLKNNTSKSVRIDMTSSNLKFQATYGDDTVDADLTLLLNDMTTYQGTLKAKKSRNMVMLFQFPKGTIKDTSKVVYTVTNGDTSSQINVDMSKQR